MIKLSSPNFDDTEKEVLSRVLDSGWVASSGPEIDTFEHEITSYTGSASSVALVNGTVSLFMSLKMIGVQQGDLVILPNLTFVASSNAIRHVGADPLLIDVDPYTWQMDLGLLKSFLDTETSEIENVRVHTKTGKIIRVIMIVHALGATCDLDELISISRDYNLAVLEDAAAAFGTMYKGIHVGNFGDLGCFSFNGNKIITTGGGGAIISNNVESLEAINHLIQQAKTSKFDYEHDQVGYNFRMSNLLAALGRTQLKKLPDFLKRKKEITETYKTELSDIEGIRFQRIDKKCTPNNWLFTALFTQVEALREYLVSENIEVRPIWKPMNRLHMNKDLIYISREDHSYKIFRGALSLPSSSLLSERDQEMVLNKIKTFYR